MGKNRFSPEHVASIIQRDFPLYDYEITEVKFKGHNDETEKVDLSYGNLLGVLRVVSQAVGLGTKPQSNSMYVEHTCHNVAYAEEYKYGLKIYFKQGNPYKYMTVRISNFKQHQH